ncbi:MAG: response regulator transcription factor [Vicinamibacterales bacterium]
MVETVTPTRLTRVLVVEDDPKVGHALREGLTQEGYEASLETTGEGAFFRLDAETFDVVLLDLTLPGRDGLQILSRMRDRGMRTPVLVLTARDSIDDRVRGLNAGADDYLVKPFAFAEMLARTRALVRRGRNNDHLKLTSGDLEMDLATRRVVRGERVIDLTLTEFDLLEHLMRHEGQIVPRDSLVRDVWKESARSTTLDNVIDVHMARLRRKLDGDSPSRLIQTVRGVGFVLRAEAGT